MDIIYASIVTIAYSRSELSFFYRRPSKIERIAFQPVRAIRPATALKRYRGGKTALRRVAETGQKANISKLGVLETVAKHQEAPPVSVPLRMLILQESARIERTESELFGESLTPFEMTKPEKREAKAIVREMNELLEKQAVARTEEVRARAETLQEPEEKYEALFEHAGNALMVVGGDGTIEEVDFTSERLTDYDRREDGKPREQLLSAATIRHGDRYAD